MAQSRRLRAEEKRKGTFKPADEQSKRRLMLSPDMEKLLALFFGAATIAGLYLAYSLATIYPLTSDMANAGLFPMEITKGNFEYVLPANNPYFFTDYLIHLIVQPLTGYSPTALVLTCYGMYVLTVVGCAALALRLAGRMEALAAAALVANLPVMGLRYVLYPLYHNGTIIFILLSLLVLYADRPPIRLDARWRAVILAVLQFLGVFSDTLMLPLFTLPLLAYSAYLFWKQRRGAGAEKSGGDVEGSPVLWIASALPAIAIYALKSRIGQLWPGGPILAESGADLGSPGNLFRHPEMIGEYFSALVTNAGGIILAIVLLAVIAYVILARKDRFLQAVLAIGGLVMLVGFTSMTMEGDPARYLTATGILALVVAATGAMRSGVSYLPLIAVAALVLVNLGSNAVMMNTGDRIDFVGAQQELVTYLESKNVTHAYADYWDANVYTYLSGGRVMIEPVYVDSDKLRFQTMNSAPGWANTWPDGNDTRPVLITTTGSSLDNWAKKVNEGHPPETTYQLSDGWIYVYNGTLPAWPA